MPLLVDTYNVLHVTGVLPPDLAGLDAEGLADLLIESAFAREEIWLVCDGPGPAVRPLARPGVRLSWSGAGISADSVLVRLIERSSAPRRIVVVSSDREIRRAGRRRGATTLTSEEFLLRLLADRRRQPPKRPDRKPEVPLGESDVRRWLAEFGLSTDLSSLASSPAPRSRPTAPASPAQPPTEARTAPPGTKHDGSLEASIDLARLLAISPPRRDDPRAPRRSRRDRR